jgi:hypothetical protein
MPSPDNRVNIRHDKTGRSRNRRRAPGPEQPRIDSPEIVVIVMSAPVVRIPSPRRPVGSAVRIPQVPAPRPAHEAGHPDGGRYPQVPAPRPVPPVGPRAAGASGRHRGQAHPVVSPAARTFTVLARAGSLTTLAAMVVLAAAVAGLADGEPPADGTGEAAVSSPR